MRCMSTDVFIVKMNYMFVYRLFVTFFELTIFSSLSSLSADLSCDNDYQFSGATSLPDEAFNASSYYSEIDTCLPKFGRLNAIGVPGVYCGAWAPAVSNQDQYLQINLGQMVQIGKILTQGRHDNAQRVSSYRISYSLDSQIWTWVVDHFSNPKIFTGNTVSSLNTVEQNLQSVEAQYVRIYPYTWNRYPSMRMDIVGCLPNPLVKKWKKSIKISGFNITDNIILIEKVHNVGICCQRCSEHISCSSVIFRQQNICQLYSEVFSTQNNYTRYECDMCQYFIPNN